MKTKKKLSKAARKKEATGINIEAAKGREAKLEARIQELELQMGGIGQLLKKFMDAIAKHIIVEMK